MFPVIIDKAIRHVDTYNSFKGMSADMIGIDMAGGDVTASQIQEFYDKMFDNNDGGSSGGI